MSASHALSYAPLPAESEPANQPSYRVQRDDPEHPLSKLQPMSLDDYLNLLDWTGRQFRTDKRGAIPAACAPILDRLDCNAETWFDLVKNFRNRFRNEAEHVLSIRAFRSNCRERRSQATTV